MIKSMDGWSALRRTGRSALLAACGLGFGMTLAFAQQVQEVPKTPPGAAKKTGEETSWIKICMKDQKTGDKQICLVKHEALEPKTGRFSSPPPRAASKARISSTSSSTYRPPIRW